MTITAETIVQMADIPPVPHILNKIWSLVENPNTTSAELEKLVSYEPALAAKILKLANSAYYSLPRKISSIGHAMILLGFSTIKSITAGMALIHTFGDLTGPSQEFISEIWAHTLKSAGFMKVFCEKFPQTVRDDLFLTAMIHDVGRIVLFQYRPDEYRALLAQSHDFPEPSVEIEKFGFDHATIGSILLKGWNFPEIVIQLVSNHHQDPHSEENKYLALLRLCDWMSKDKAQSFWKSNDVLLPETKALIELAGLKIEDLKRFEKSFDEMDNMMKNFFS